MYRGASARRSIAPDSGYHAQAAVKDMVQRECGRYAKDGGEQKDEREVPRCADGVVDQVICKGDREYEHQEVDQIQLVGVLAE